MSKKFEHIDHLSPELIRQYREGSLSAEKMYAVEKYLLENPFEAEALEGMEEMSPEQLGQHVEDINSLVDQRLEKEEKTKVIFWTNTRRIAAGLVFILSASFVYFWIDQNEALEEAPTKELTLKTDDKEGANKDGSPEESQKESSAPPEAVELVDSTQMVAQAEVVEPVAEAAEFDLDMEFTEESVVAAEDAKMAVVEEEILIAESAAIEPKREKEKAREIVAPAPPVKPEVLALTTATALTDTSSLQASNSLSSLLQRDPVLITGRVLDAESGDPLPQVTILVEGTTQGTPTDADGHFSMRVDTVGKKLIARFLGYTTQTVDLNKGPDFTFNLEPDVTSVGEVVVTAYGVSRSKNRLNTQPSVKSAVIPRYRNFTAFAKDNLIYPQEALDNDISGRVVLEFDLSAEGESSNYRVVKGLGYGCDEEAIRLVKAYSGWVPAVDSRTNRPQASQKRVKIRFKP